MSPTPQWYDADTDDSDRFEEVGTLHGVRIVVDHHLDPTPTAERAGEVLDLEAIEDEFLQMCGPCDAGVAASGCSCPTRDYRGTMSALVGRLRELEAPVEAHDAQACRDIAAAQERARDRHHTELAAAHAAMNIWMDRAEAAEAKVARVEGLADELERDRDVCLAWIKDEAKHVDPDHPNRLSGMADLLNQHASKIRAALVGGGDK